MSARVRKPEPEHRRTRQPVLRNSHPMGKCEGVVWRPFDRRQIGRHLLAAERFDLRGKKFGERHGPLGAYGVRVLRELLRTMDYRSGRLDPAITTLCVKLRLSKTAVVGALKALAAAKFVRWVRRFEPTGLKTGERGPQVRQATNAYGIDLPPTAARLLDEPPPPVDFEAARAARAEELRAMAGQAWDETPAGQAFHKALRTRNAIPPGGHNPSSGSYERGEG